MRRRRSGAARWHEPSESEVQKQETETMSKKHFIALADTLRELKPDAQYSAYKTFNEGMLRQWQIQVQALAEFCQSQNREFKRDRWLD